MNRLTELNLLYTFPETDNDNVLELRSGPETEMEIASNNLIQFRVQQSFQASRHTKTSLLAYGIWQKEGCPQSGRALENWIEAEKANSVDSTCHSVS
jgi:hypothetical protein